MKKGKGCFHLVFVVTLIWEIMERKSNEAGRQSFWEIKAGFAVSPTWGPRSQAMSSCLHHPSMLSAINGPSHILSFLFHHAPTPTPQVHNNYSNKLVSKYATVHPKLGKALHMVFFGSIRKNVGGNRLGLLHMRSCLKLWFITILLSIYIVVALDSVVIIIYYTFIPYCSNLFVLNCL